MERERIAELRAKIAQVALGDGVKEVCVVGRAHPVLRSKPRRGITATARATRRADSIIVSVNNLRAPRSGATLAARGDG